MTRGRSTIGLKLPYLTDRHIEDEAALLLAEFGNKHGQVTAPPIPIDDIIVLYLELTFEFKDMQALFGVGDVHGALWVNERRVGVDASLDPEQHPVKLGRYRFTLAHEAGHWRLHRHLFQKRANQLSLLPEDAQRAEYVCRSTDRDPVEIQANKFAAALLMPREMVKTVWHKWRGQMEPICLPDLESKRRQILTAEVLRRGGLKQSENAADDMVLEHLARPLAERFQVSAEAMRIRLENMGLLLRKKEPTLFD